MENSVVIYPEIFSDNPLGARHVIRWILRAPTDESTTEHSLIKGNVFYYREKFVENQAAADRHRRLQTPYYPLHMLTPRHLPRVRKYCYIRHKNTGADPVDLGADAVCLDGLGVSEVMKVLRESEYFVSYDTETGYTRLATICGAIPVVMPKDGVPKDVWRPMEQERLGIAYGLDDQEIEWAVQTRDQELAFIRSLGEAARQDVRSFVDEVARIYP